MVEIQGYAEDGFGAVADAFRANFDGVELGAGFCLYVDGRKVVDLTGGYADVERTRPYDDDSLQLVFSSTKGVAAICLAMLFEQGMLDYEAKVASIWPEFGAAGKENIPISWPLSHRAGLATVDNPPPIEEVLKVQPILDALADQAPLWELDGSHGYHAITYGWIAAEILHRLTGVRMNAWLQEHVVAPLGAEFWMGLPEAQNHRVSLVRAGAPPADPVSLDRLLAMFAPGAMGGRALTLDMSMGLLDANMSWNRPDVWSSEIPAVGGITNAASLARIYAATVGEVDGVRLFGDATRELVTTPVTAGIDKSLLLETKFGMGFMLTDGILPWIGPRTFGHVGAGGSAGYADPDLGIGFGYVMNQMAPGILGDERSGALTAAVRGCL